MAIIFFHLLVREQKGSAKHGHRGYSQKIKEKLKNFFHFALIYFLGLEDFDQRRKAGTASEQLGKFIFLNKTI